MSRQVVKYFTDGREGQMVTAIIGSPGRIYTPMVYIESPIRLRKIANGEIDSKACRVIEFKPKKAARTMLGVSAGISRLRGRVHDYRGIPLVPTYHPAALLRNASWKTGRSARVLSPHGSGSSSSKPY